MYSLLQWCKGDKQLHFMYLYIILYMENNKAQNTIQEKGIEDILFFTNWLKFN